MGAVMRISAFAAFIAAALCASSATAQVGRVPKLSRDFVAAVFDQARKHNKLTMAHIVELADARMAVDEGVNMLVHNVRDQDISADFLATLKARNVSVISTLAREEGMFRAGGGKPQDPFFVKGA